MKHLFLFCLALIAVLQPKAQNLVTNSSFETVTAEPYYGCEITNATGWLNPSNGGCPNNGAGTPDLFSTFSTGQAVLPNSFMGTLNAHTGNRCTGIVTYHQQITNYREYLQTRLSCPLVVGQPYTISFWTNGATSPQYIYHTNNLGVYFSVSTVSQTGYNIIPGLVPQIEETTVVANNTWTFYTYTFTPTQPYEYLCIANFRTDANTQVQTFGTNRPYAYYFLDDISVTPNNSGVFSLGSDTTYCGSFTRTLSTGNANTLWSTGVTAAQITVTTPGTYWASIVNGCSGGASDTIVISQNVAPVVSLGNDTTYCGSFTRVLSTGNAGTSWSTGVTATQITVNTPGTYTATISNGCGSSSDNIVLTQNAVPVVNLGNDTALCTGQTMVLNAGNAGSAYQWQDNSANATFNVSTAGNYAVTVTNAAGCSASDAINVTYTSGPPIIDLGNDTTYCGSFTRVLAAGNASTVWSTGVTAAQITVTMPGTYSATVSNGCGSATDAIILSQNALPVVNLGNDTSLCTGQTAVLDAGNAGATYQWQDNSTNSTFNVSVAGNYIVTVTNASGCSASDAVVVSYVSALPVIALGNDTTYCGNFLRTLNAGNPNTLWSTGVTSQQINVTAAGIYWAQQTNACGTTRDSIQFSQLPVPSVSLGNDTSICNGQTVQLTATSSVSNFLWSDGSSANSLNVSTVGTYWVEVDLAGCKARDSVIISTGLVPVFNLGFDTTVCGDELTLLVHAQNAQYQWQDLTTDSFYRVTASGIYSVTVSNACGSAIDEVDVDIERDRCAILVPTGFSPNNDGANDVFRAISRCPVTRFSMHVYNRWGEEVFTTDDVTEGWNGVYRDKAQPLSVYVYYIDYFNYCEQKMKKVVGNVTLVR